MLADTVRRFRDLRVLVIGDAMVDTYMEGIAQRICSEGPVPVVQKTVESHFPGGAANTAANLSALGAEVDFLTLTGEDEGHGLLAECLAQAAVHDRLVVRDPEASTIRKMRIVAGGQFVVRFDEGRAHTWSARARERLLGALEEAYDLCDLVVVSDYGYGTVTKEMLARLKQLREGRPVPLCVDAKDIRPYRSAGATLITPNHLEALVAVERRIPMEGAPNVDEIDSIGRRLLTLIDAEQLAITLAADGVYLLNRRGECRHLPVPRVDSPHDIGAGDSFLAAMALSMAAGCDFFRAGEIAVRASWIAVTKERTAVTGYHELLQGLSLPAGQAGSYTDVLRRAEEHRTAGRRVVFANGVFDILHAGHVDFLKRARSLGDVLIVGVNSDESARSLKGRNRPINGERDRLALVSALDSVDEAFLFDAAEPSAVIRALRPAIHVKGGDYEGEDLPEAAAVAEVGGHVVILPLAGSVSTTAIIERITRLRESERIEAGA